MSATKEKHRQLLLASLLAIVLLGSSMLASNFSAYADKDSKNNDKKNNEQNGDHDDQHKKPKKDPDKDKDNDRKECKHGDTNKHDKYRHSCDSDHDHFA